MNASDVSSSVLTLFYMGKAPSEIDRQLNLVSGTARLFVIAEWARDKNEARYDRSDSGWMK